MNDQVKALILKAIFIPLCGFIGIGISVYLVAPDYTAGAVGALILVNHWFGRVMEARHGGQS